MKLYHFLVATILTAVLCAALFLLTEKSSLSFDNDSYCAGWCRGRYQDGFFKNGKCACVDYFKINLSDRIDTPVNTGKNVIIGD